MEETIYGIIGLIMLYSIGHFIVIQHKFKWDRRTTYQQGVTVVALISIGLILFGVMFG